MEHIKKQPGFLKNGSVIGITCPSGYVSAERVEPMIRILESWGFHIKKGKTIGSSDNYFSGTDAERLEDLQTMLDDPELEAIVMGRGGYGMSRIIDRLDFTYFLEKPKWICGFSDITVLHNHIQAQYGIPTLHSPMSGHFKPENEYAPFLLSMRDALMGKRLSYSAPYCEQNRLGIAEGILTGGNLALVANMTGSASEVDNRGKILFLEDVGEYLYSIDRMMVHLKRAGKFDGLAGLIFGGFTDMKDTERPFGKTIEHILADAVKEYNYPLCFHFPAGHQDENFTLNFGRMHKLEVTAQGGSLENMDNSFTH